MFDVIIIGAGPAGLSSAIYATRGGLNVAIIEGNVIGGLSTLTNDIENYPGYSSISGYDLCDKMREQAEKFGANFIYDTVEKVELIGKEKKVTTSYSGELKAKIVILALGTKARKLGIKNEDLYIGNGISYCATCDGNFYKGKSVAVVGGGNSALTEAMYLGKIAKKVYLIHRRDAYRADKILGDRLKESKVEPILSSTIENFEGMPLESLVIQNKKENKEKKIQVDGLFVAIGTIPSTKLVEGQIKLDENGYIKTNAHMKTNLKNVYAVGDARAKHLRQVITACNDGAIAGEQAILVLM